MKVIQVMPAPNWSATFIDPDTHTKGNSRPLVCWALMEDGTIAGMVVEEHEIKAVTDVHEDFSSYHCFGAAHTM